MLKVFSSLRARVLLLIGIPFAVMLGMIIYETLGEREERLADAREQLIATTRLMAAEQWRIIERAHHILLSVALLPELRRGIEPEVCSRVLANKVKEGAVFVNMLVAQPNGEAICNAIGTAHPINIADRDFFQRALQTHEFVVGGYIISRSTGKPAIGIAYPLLDEAGRPEAVVSATLDIGWLGKELAKFNLPERSDAVVLGHEGTVLARHPDPEGWVGKAAPADMPLVKTVLNNGGEGTADELGLDGVRRIFAFTPLHEATTGQVYLWVGIPKDAVVGAVERGFVRTVLIAFALLVLTFGAFWLGSERLFLGRIVALGKAATKLGKGELTARTGLQSGSDEIAQLAQSFDQMAAALEAKERQLTRTNRALRTLSACNEALVRAGNESGLLDSICRLIVETGGYRMAWVGFPEQDPAKTVRVVAQFGYDEGYLEAAKISWADSERGRGPTGTAIRTGTVQMNWNFLTEPALAPWREAALKRGYQSSIALPLKSSAGTMGVLTIYASEPDAFNEAEVALLQELAEDLAFGIEALRARAALAKSEERLQLEIDRMPMAHIVWDTGFRVVSWNPAAEKIFGYTAAEALDRHPYELIVPKEAQLHVDTVWRRLLAGDASAYSVNENITKDGRTILCEWTNTPLKRPDGAVLGVMSMTQDITERKAAENALARASRALRTLSMANEALVRATSEEELLQGVTRIIVEIGGYRLATVCYAGDDPEKSIAPVAWVGEEEGCCSQERATWADTEKGQVPIARAIRSGTPQVCRDIAGDPAFAPWQDAGLTQGYVSNIALPLSDGRRTFGGLSIYSSEIGAFDEEEARLLTELADDLAYGIVTLRTRADRDRIAYEHLHHAEILRESLEDSIKAIADTVEMRDPYTAGHQKRVSQLAVAISRELGLPEETIHGIELAASIHDLGKISVPAEILVKPAKLTDIELMLIRNHAQAGYNILKDIKFPWPIAIMVLQHHERLDGSGYPQGLKDGEILLESRIMAVADVVEAMASHRPYRAALGAGLALKEIERGRGTIYDAAVVDACLRLFREKRFALST